MAAVYIGIVGVTLLLIAFVLNLIKKISESSKTYLLMNVAGGLMASWYAYAGNTIPFVVLELVWAVTALSRLIVVIKKGSR